MDEKANNILRDPMHYSPYSSKPDMASDGSRLEKRSFKQDWDYVSHP
jgi:hypothetical protein